MDLNLLDDLLTSYRVKYDLRDLEGMNVEIRVSGKVVWERK